MTPPLFSVVSAAYNQAPYLEAMLDSVAAQTCRDAELIVVDDGSTDDTPERLHAWRLAHRKAGLSRVVMVRIENAGQSAALEYGFSLARGRWICLLDADDVFLPEKLTRLARASSEAPEAGMIVHPMHVVDADGRRTGEVRPKAARLLGGDLRQQVRRDARIAVPGTSAIALRADLVERMLPMPTRQYKTMADAYLPLAASLLAPVHVIDEPLAEYRMQPGGAHLQSLRSPDGLARWLEVQSLIARHLGIPCALDRNVTFARNAFALAKLTRSWAEALARYPRLAALTLADAAMPPVRRLPLAAAWTLMACAPRPLFERLWGRYLVEATGWSRLSR
jgi:Glycosyl transferase family 2